MGVEDPPVGDALAAQRLKLVKRSVSIRGHRTSVSLEEAFWRRLQAIAERRGASVSAVIAEIDASRGSANLSSAIRVAMLESAVSVEA